MNRPRTAHRAETPAASTAALVPGSVPPDTLAAEAARFALLCRLTPALRHEAAAPMQPLAMAASVLDRRLSAPSPDPRQLREGVQKLVDYSRKAAQGALELVAWLAPERQTRRPLGAAVEDALALLATPLAFEGFTVQATLGPSEAALPVSSGALRLVLPACLLWLTDQAQPPAAVSLLASRWEAGVVLRLSLSRPLDETAAGEGDGEDAAAGPRREPAYRRLGDAEVMALARSEGLALALQGTALELCLPDER